MSNECAVVPKQPCDKLGNDNYSQIQSALSALNETIIEIHGILRAKVKSLNGHLNDIPECCDIPSPEGWLDEVVISISKLQNETNEMFEVLKQL